ncbi:hypothetical protein ACFRDV_04480 [Streptomyces fagopyri]|uniref:hypothetical protein n=1 Tax=Streptomyces fagopyri TaxID=2662397 RepID=UPI0036C292D3
MQDRWRDQTPATGVTVRDDGCQEVFRPLSIDLGTADKTLKRRGETAEAADTRIDVEPAVQDGTPHVWLDLDRVTVRAVYDDFARPLPRTLPYTDCLVGDDHVLLRLHGDLEPDPLHLPAAAGMDAYASGPKDRRRLIEQVADEPKARSTPTAKILVCGADGTR